MSIKSSTDFHTSGVFDEGFFAQYAENEIISAQAQLTDPYPDSIQANIDRPVNSFNENSQYQTNLVNSEVNFSNVGKASLDDKYGFSSTGYNDPNNVYWSYNGGPPPYMANSQTVSIESQASGIDRPLEETGIASEAAEAASSVTSGAAMAVPMINQNLMSEINQNSFDMAKMGKGEEGVAVGHNLVDQQNNTNKQIAATIGSGLMFAGLATGDPIIGAAGIATGVVAETIGPQMMNNSQVVPSTSGDLISPQ
uniref:Uncharacterized protein n=1 Tax=Elmago virus TaxID=3077879 RepID=A0AA96H9V5_9VIRU|nr:MAG: hypothetical protein [Elmago virus]